MSHAVYHHITINIRDTEHSNGCLCTWDTGTQVRTPYPSKVPVQYSTAGLGPNEVHSLERSRLSPKLIIYCNLQYCPTSFPESEELNHRCGDHYSKPTILILGPPPPPRHIPIHFRGPIRISQIIFIGIAIRVAQLRQWHGSFVFLSYASIITYITRSEAMGSRERCRLH